MRVDQASQVLPQPSPSMSRHTVRRVRQPTILKHRKGDCALDPIQYSANAAGPIFCTHVIQVVKTSNLCAALTQRACKSGRWSCVRR